MQRLPLRGGQGHKTPISATRETGVQGEGGRRPHAASAARAGHGHRGRRSPHCPGRLLAWGSKALKWSPSWRALQLGPPAVLSGSPQGEPYTGAQRGDTGRKQAAWRLHPGTHGTSCGPDQALPERHSRPSPRGTHHSLL